jgi:hypothetical protein
MHDVICEYSRELEVGGPEKKQREGGKRFYLSGHSDHGARACWAASPTAVEAFPNHQVAAHRLIILAQPKNTDGGHEA